MRGEHAEQRMGIRRGVCHTHTDMHTRTRTHARARAYHDAYHDVYQVAAAQPRVACGGAGEHRRDDRALHAARGRALDELQPEPAVGVLAQREARAHAAHGEAEHRAAVRAQLRRVRRAEVAQLAREPEDSSQY